MKIKELLKKNIKLKKLVLLLIQSKNRPRPRYWIKLFVNPLVHFKGRGSYISKNTRIDVFPYNDFVLGSNSVIESFCCLNNGVGDVVIGDNTRIGISNTIIGPVKIGSVRVSTILPAAIIEFLPIFTPLSAPLKLVRIQFSPKT